MFIKQKLINAALQNGYIKKDYGYKRITKNNTHWISIFSSGKFQMYAYYSNDPERDKIYDTGVIQTSTERLSLLIEILINNHF